MWLERAQRMACVLRRPLLSIADLLFLPVRIILRPDHVRRWHLTPIEDDRLYAVLRHTRGALLDVGCGGNRLVRQHGRGVGVDVYPWTGIDVLADAARLPFANRGFDTVTILASLNHFPERQQSLREARRVLVDDGQILITMINPVVGYIGHNYLHGWRGADFQERGMGQDEVWGLWSRELHLLLEQAGLELVKRCPFVYGLNNLYIVRKKGVRA